MKNSRKNEGLTRRDFLIRTGIAGAGLMLMPDIGMGMPGSGRLKADKGRMLLRNGLIVDGTGKKGYIGSILVENGKIVSVDPDRAPENASIHDCTGLVIAPGFIDAHSHMDWYLPVKGHAELKTPFTEQGITTFAAGQCGFGIAGFRKDSKFMNLVQNSINKSLFKIEWTDMSGYFEFIKMNGMSHNLINLAGHGTTRASIRGFDASPMKPEEMKEMLSLLEQSMDEGAYGVSLGLQYEPGLFATNDELLEIARLVKKKNKVLTVHLKAYSSLSGTYPIKPFGTPHNIIAIKEMLEIAKKTGVRLQISHLIFVGSRTFKTYPDAIALIDNARKEGLDVKLDTYAYHCGTSIINVFLPPWFLAKTPQIYEDKWAMRRLRIEAALILGLLGFGYEDIQITYANHPDLNRFNGMSIAEIAKARNMSGFECLVDIAKKSGGVAHVLNHNYSNDQIVESLIRHPATLFMTDANIALQGVQNPASFGNYPLILQTVRDKKLVSLEETVRKMTGAVAERYHVKDRGLIKEGLAADITVFDYRKIKDNNTRTQTDMKPTGIEAVFINGVQVVSKGKADGNLNAGVVVK
jgi:N-acyl-D-amino-acid deacylase